MESYHKKTNEASKKDKEDSLETADMKKHSPDEASKQKSDSLNSHKKEKPSKEDNLEIADTKKHSSGKIEPSNIESQISNEENKADKKKHSEKGGEENKADKKKHSEKGEPVNKEETHKPSTKGNKKTEHEEGKYEKKRHSLEEAKSLKNKRSLSEESKSSKKKHSMGKDDSLNIEDKKTAIDNTKLKSKAKSSSESNKSVKKTSSGKVEPTDSKKLSNERRKSSLNPSHSEGEVPVHKKAKMNRDADVNGEGETEKQKTDRDSNISNGTESHVFGFIGAGSIGNYIIKHLIDKFKSSETGDKLIFWDFDKSTSYDLDGVKVRAVASLDELLDQSDVIMWYILTKRVSSILFYNQLVFRHKLSGKYLIDLTNTDPQHALQLYDTVNDEGGFYLDVRLHGGLKEAREGKLVTFASGNIEAYEVCEKYLAAFSVKMKYFGPQAEKAAKMSAMINVVKAVNLEAVALLHAFAEAQSLVSLEELKTFATSPLGPLPKTVEEHSFENKEDKQLAIRCMKEDIESIIFSKNYNETEQPMHCTRILYKFICNLNEMPETSQSTNNEKAFDFLSI